MKSGVGKRWLKFLLTVLVSLVFAYFFVRDLDLGEVAETLLAADYVYVPFALALFGLSLVLRAVRWGVFYRPDSPRFNLLFPVVLVTYAGNNLLPLRAGELLRAQLLRDRAGVSRMRTLGTAGIERLFDVLVLGIFLVAGMLVAGIGLAYVSLGVGLTLAAILGFAVCLLIALRPELPGRLAERRWPLLPRALAVRIASYATLFISGFSVLTAFSRFRDAALLTAGAWTLEFGMYWLLAQSFELGQSFFTIAFAGAAANLALSIPSAQGGVGPFQWAAKEALVRLGVAATPAAAYAVALHVVLVAPVSIVGLLVFWAMLPQKNALLRTALASDAPLAPEPSDSVA